MEMLHKASDQIVKLVQNNYLSNKMERMKSDRKNLDKGNPLCSLDSFPNECAL